MSQAVFNASQVRCLLRVVIYLAPSNNKRQYARHKTQTLAGVQSIFHTCYLRGVFPEHCFKEVPMAGLDGEPPDTSNLYEVHLSFS